MSGGLAWVCYQGGLLRGRGGTRQAAMNLVDRPFRSGNAMVRHSGTGETWVRRNGSWFLEHKHWPKKEMA